MTLCRVKPHISLAIDESVWNGDRVLDLGPYEQEIPDTTGNELEPLQSLLDHALTLELDREVELDQWLAPRVHSALRISPMIAGDKWMWTWLCLKVGMPYLRRRWSFRMYRLTGDFKRNGLARLWFFSEMARNGSDYADVRRVLRNPGTAQYALENRYAMYRPAVIAFGRLAEERSMSFEEMKQLSKHINAYLSLRSLEATGYAPLTEEYDSEWWTDLPTLKELIEVDPQGPNDHRVPESSILELKRWYGTLLSDNGSNGE
jgi:uncharacterized protein DUF6339